MSGGQDQENREIDRVVPFGRRAGRPASVRQPLTASSPVENVGKYEQASGERDDFAHRMMMNAAGLAVCGVLVFTGIWIALKMADIRRDQDCVLAGHRNCARIAVGGSPP